MNIGVIGEKGERLTADFLRKNGCAVIKRNYACRYGEIDIIAENDEYIIFVEVKTRKKNSLTSPAESVNFGKQKRIMLTAQDYLTKVICEKQPRFDVAAVTVEETKDGKRYHLDYIENAF